MKSCASMARSTKWAAGMVAKSVSMLFSPFVRYQNAKRTAGRHSRTVTAFRSAKYVKCGKQPTRTFGAGRLLTGRRALPGCSVMIDCARERAAGEGRCRHGDRALYLWKSRRGIEICLRKRLSRSFINPSGCRRLGHARTLRGMSATKRPAMNRPAMRPMAWRDSNPHRFPVDALQLRLGYTPLSARCHRAGF